MTVVLTTDSPEIASQKIQNAQAKQGMSLENYFYRSRLIYQRDLEEIVRKTWIYACHTSELPNNGDFNTLEIDEDSIIIVRGNDGEIRALANSCRHRGARVCPERQGNKRSFACPYHAWVYDLDGSLRAARSMGDDFDRSQYRLKPLRTHIFKGMIFINYNENATDFSKSTALLEDAMAPYHLENAKLAGKKSYRIKANWKLTLENYLECYHCGPSHKEYAKSHTLREEPDAMEATHNPAMRERALKAGYSPGVLADVYRDYAVSTDFGCEVHHGRYALYEGFKTGSLDGEPVAPLMGDFRKFGYDGGAGDFCIGPLNFMLNYPDHCVLYRFLPISLQESECFISWFVDGDAIEGTDYDPERVMKLWDHTTKEDEFIIMRNHEGVNASFFEPGPYSPIFETLCIDFIEWYLKALAR